jgi:hypothetical protein
MMANQTATTGFYSYGDFILRLDTSDSVLHDPTMKIGNLNENLI